ncbi:hypothetical protein DL762_003881 [Monosporascus cannonballus]|uniref:Uncharacterized protein n=1 Tax=Monosporascus cannonballus TaxID=155416 RepID=A0ABY0H9U2_9PEZI|nr:hypothetical protein DL762_003881 [Monosporascus cannonballus]
MQPSPTTETELRRGGDVVLLDGLPAKFTIGCDRTTLSTSKPFHGFRDIPSGAHLIWVAATDSTSSRNGFWIFTPKKTDYQPGRVCAKRWDAFNETLDDPPDGAEERLEHIFPGLYPYRFPAAGSAAPRWSLQQEADPAVPDFLDDASIWSQLTFAINPELLSSITRRNQANWPVTSSDRVLGESRTSEEAALYSNSGGGSSQLRFRFRMDGPLFDPAAEGAERTRQALDPTTWILGVLEEGTKEKTSEISKTLNDERRPADPAPNPDPNPDLVLVGELQFAFLTGAHLGNFSCLEQWHFTASRLAFRAHDLAARRPRLARDLVRTFHAQLAYGERFLENGAGGDDLLEATPGGAEALRKCLVTYKAHLEETLRALGDARARTPEHDAVADAFGALEAWLRHRSRRGWDLGASYVRSGGVMLEDGEVMQAELSEFADEDERGEFAPVVMRLDDDGRPTDLVSWDA